MLTSSWSSTRSWIVSPSKMSLITGIQKLPKGTQEPNVSFSHILPTLYPFPFSDSRGDTSRSEVASPGWHSHNATWQSVVGADRSRVFRVLRLDAAQFEAGLLLILVGWDEWVTDVRCGDSGGSRGEEESGEEGEVDVPHKVLEDKGTRSEVHHSHPQPHLTSSLLFFIFILL